MSQGDDGEDPKTTPFSTGRVTLDFNVQLYAWHGRHHLAHVAGLRERNAW